MQSRPTMKWQKGEFRVTNRFDDLDLDFIHHFLQSSYWAKGIPKAIVAKSLKNSLCFGLFHHDKQIGFGRVITDRATFAYLSDVFVIEPYQGRGLGKWLVSCILKHPELKGLRRWLLGTQDAHGLYKQVGFVPLSQPEWFMERYTPDIYILEEKPPGEPTQ
jgi:GNAT superfamily N-acetyltransferase